MTKALEQGDQISILEDNFTLTDRHVLSSSLTIYRRDPLSVGCLLINTIKHLIALC